MDKALHLVDLYVARGVDPKRLYIKVIHIQRLCGRGGALLRLA